MTFTVESLHPLGRSSELIQQEIQPSQSFWLGRWRILRRLSVLRWYPLPFEVVVRRYQYFTASQVATMRLIGAPSMKFSTDTSRWAWLQPIERIEL